MTYGYHRKCVHRLKQVLQHARTVQWWKIDWWNTECRRWIENPLAICFNQDYITIMEVTSWFLKLDSKEWFYNFWIVLMYFLLFLLLFFCFVLYLILFACFEAGIYQFAQHIWMYYAKTISWINWGMSDCCLTPIQQFFSYIMARTS